MRRRRSLIVAAVALETLAVLGLALGACAAPEPGAASEASATDQAPVPAGLERFYGQRLAWAPCATLAAPPRTREIITSDPAFECARLEVPLDYAAPAGRTAQVAVLRVPTERERIGSLVLNPGGPGGSGLELAAVLSGTLGGGPFDVVGFDPRGIGASTPKLVCHDAAEWAAQRADADLDPSPAGVARAEQKARATARACVERSGIDVLANAGTRDVARDLDVLRAALGDRKLTYLGFSYGTRIGSVYAEMFPANVRAMVLDGAVDPEQGVPDRIVDQWASFQRQFQAYAQDCARKPDCPLGTDPSRATERYRQLVGPLLERPAPVPGSTRTLSYTDAFMGTVSVFYDVRAWPDLTVALNQLRAGEGTALLGLADAYFDGPVTPMLVVNCLDGERITDRAVAGEMARRVYEVAPFADPGRGARAALDTCAYLPVTPTWIPHRPAVEGLPPVLVVSTTGDPATPYQAGVRLARALGGHLLTVQGDQHGAAAAGYPCVDDIVADYLVDLETPDDDARCVLPRPAPVTP